MSQFLLPRELFSKREVLRGKETNRRQFINILEGKRNKLFATDSPNPPKSQPLPSSTQQASPPKPHFDRPALSSEPIHRTDSEAQQISSTEPSRAFDLRRREERKKRSALSLSLASSVSFGSPTRLTSQNHILNPKIPPLILLIQTSLSRRRSFPPLQHNPRISRFSISLQRRDILLSLRFLNFLNQYSLLPFPSPERSNSTENGSDGEMNRLTTLGFDCGTSKSGSEEGGSGRDGLGGWRKGGCWVVDR